MSNRHISFKTELESLDLGEIERWMKKLELNFFPRRFPGIQHTIRGRNGKELEDDLFVDPMNYEVCGVLRNHYATIYSLSYQLHLSSLITCLI